MLRRMVLAARLDVPFYEEVEANPRYTMEALLVVLLAAMLSAIGTALAYPGEGWWAMLSGILGTVFAWVAWSGITLWIGTTLTRGPDTRSDMGEMLRVLGYAHTPQVLILLVFVPIAGPLIAIGATIWSLLAGVIAIRQALDFTTTRALFTVLIGWFVVHLLRVLLRVFL